MLSLGLTGPALAEEASPAGSMDGPWCQSQPERCERMQQRIQEGCAAYPKRCEQIKARAAKWREQCQADPKACEAKIQERMNLPVRVMNGTEDRHVPWYGGPVMVFGKAYGDVVSTSGSVGYWLAANGLEEVRPASRWLPNTARHDHCRVQVTAYRQRGKPIDVFLYTLQGGGHVVPGSNVPQRTLFGGNKCMDIDAGEVIWEFLSRHTLSEGEGT